MKPCILLLALFVCVSVACEQKAAPTAPEESETGATDGDQRPQHVDTNRAAFKAAGAAAKQIEAKGAERNSAADDALKAGR